MKITINAPRVCDEENVAGELERIANLIREGFTSGEVHGGWWDMSGEYALRSGDDSREVEIAVARAFQQKFRRKGKPVYEHNQWWITTKGGGSILGCRCDRPRLGRWL